MLILPVEKVTFSFKISKLLKHVVARSSAGMRFRSISKGFCMRGRARSSAGMDELGLVCGDTHGDHTERLFFRCFVPALRLAPPRRAAQDGGGRMVLLDLL